MSFKEFLKQKILSLSFLKDVRGLSTRHYFGDGVENTKTLFIKKLGEWGYIEMELWDIQVTFTEPYVKGNFDFARKIAEGCLGRKEVEKRWDNYLKKKELEKKEWEKQKKEYNLSAEKQAKELEKYFVQKQGQTEYG